MYCISGIVKTLNNFPENIFFKNTFTQLPENIVKNLNKTMFPEIVQMFLCFLNRVKTFK